MSGPFMRLGYGGGGQAHGGDTGAGAGAGGQVAGHGEGLRRQGAEAHLVAPAVEKLPLGLIDALGVVGEDGLQGFGHALVGGAQSRQGCRFPEDDLGAGGGGHGRVSGGGRTRRLPQVKDA